MKIGVWHPDKYVLSVRIYYEQVRDILSKGGVTFVPFGRQDELPDDVDLYWDPTCTGGKHPNRRFKQATHPLVVTVHGASNWSLPLSINFQNKKSKIKGVYNNIKRKSMWRYMRMNVAHIVTVSSFAKEEIQRYLPLEGIPITPIYHGFDNKVFNGNPRKTDEFATYFFHVSVYQPKKNVDLILRAYQKLDEKTRIPLILVCPGYPEKIEMPGLKLIRDRIGRMEVANYLRESSGFIFPSIHESFGIPLIEALSCGCPIITSNQTACPEIVGDAGLKVNPRDADELSAQMLNLMSDAQLRADLSSAGLERAKAFSWTKCAQEHLDVFNQTLGSK